MQREKSVYLHDREVVPKENECGDIYDVLRTIPKMGNELQGTGGQEPDKVADDDVPGWEMKTALEDRDSALVHDIDDERGPGKKGERVEELVNLPTGL